MALSETARLIAALELDPRKFTKGLSTADKAMGKFESRAFKAGQQIGTGIKNAGRLAAVGIGVLTSQVVLGLDSLVKLEQQEAQTAAVLKSTGAAAGLHSRDITQLAEKYENLNATIGDEFIRQGANMILTFTNIRKKSFEPTLAAVLDMNTALGRGPEGLTNTAILVGKALNDPVRGLTALRRVGVQLTDTQVKQIKSLVKQGKLYSAQQIILKELNREFGGSFLAQGDTTAGSVAKFTDAIEDLQRALATALLPTVRNVADSLSKLLADPAVINDAKRLGENIGKLFSPANIDKGIAAFQSVFRAAKEAAPIIADAARITGAALKVAIDTFKSLPPEIQKLAIAGLAVNKLTGGLVTNIAGGLISSVLKQLTSGVVNVRGASVIVTGAAGVGGGPVPAGGGKGGSRLGNAANLISKVFVVGLAAEAASELSGPINQLGKDLLAGLRPQEFDDFGAAWERWRASADWPFGQKNAPEWVGGAPTPPTGTVDPFVTAGLPKDRLTPGGKPLPVLDGHVAAQTEKAAARLLAIEATNKRTAIEIQRRGERQVQSTDAAKASAAASAARMIAAQNETRRETNRGASATAAAARSAGERARQAAFATRDAVVNKDLSVKIINQNTVRISVRDMLAKTTFQQRAAEYG